MSLSSTRPPSRQGSAPSEECERLIQLHYFHIPLVSALHSLGNRDNDRQSPLTDCPSPRMSPTPSIASESDISDGVSSAVAGMGMDLYTGLAQPPSLGLSSGKRKTPSYTLPQSSTHGMKTRSQGRMVSDDFWELDASGKRCKKTNPLGG